MGIQFTKQRPADDEPAEKDNAPMVRGNGQPAGGSLAPYRQHAAKRGKN